MTRSVVVSIFVLMIFCAGALAQEPGGQDTSGGGPLRPRRDTYIIVPFPSPALRSQSVTVEYYNHNPEEIEVRIVDILDRTVEELQPRTFVDAGRHKLQITKPLVSGTYFIRLTSYTSTGSKKQVQDLRFIIAH